MLETLCGQSTWIFKRELKTELRHKDELNLFRQSF